MYTLGFEEGGTKGAQEGFLRLGKRHNPGDGKPFEGFLHACAVAPFVFDCREGDLAAAFDFSAEAPSVYFYTLVSQHIMFFSPNYQALCPPKNGVSSHSRGETGFLVYKFEDEVR